MKERIEIFPGHWIEVTRRIKEKAGVKLSTRVIATLQGGEVHRAAGDAGRSLNKGAKYSRLIIEEALRLARTMGERAAAEKTGVNKWTIQERKKKLRGPTGRDGSRYTLAQKRALVEMAKGLMRSGEIKTRRARGGKMVQQPKWAHRPAFIEAGRRLGMNGRVIEYQWVNGLFSLTDVPSSPPRPPASAADQSVQPVR